VPIEELRAALHPTLIEYTRTYTDWTPFWRGGHHRVYRHRYSEAEFREHPASRFTGKLLKEFPEETRRAISHLS